MTKEGLYQCLCELGGTADEVAASLARRGIRGVPENPGACPLAAYVAGLGLASVSVSDVAVLVWPDDGPVWFVALPDPCKGFVPLFDEGVYPHLDLEAAP